MSHFYQNQVANEQAIAMLSNAEDAIRPAERLYLACKYTVLQWIRPTLLKLIKTRVADITNEDIAWLEKQNPGGQPFHQLTIIREKIQVIRTSLLRFSPPAIHHESCLPAQQAQCEEDFKFKVLNPHLSMLLNPNWASNGHDVLAALWGRVGYATMQNESCLEANLQEISTKGYLWSGEERVVSEAEALILGHVYTGGI